MTLRSFKGATVDFYIAYESASNTDHFSLKVQIHSCYVSRAISKKVKKWAIFGYFSGFKGQNRGFLGIVGARREKGKNEQSSCLSFSISVKISWFPENFSLSKTLIPNPCHGDIKVF